MLLQDSALKCHPLSEALSVKSFNDKGQRRTVSRVVSAGGTCSCCGIRVTKGLEGHGGAKLCPFCHATLHLREASSRRLGTLIWLPELEQSDFTLMQVAAFMLDYVPEPLRQQVLPIRDTLHNTILKSVGEWGESHFFEAFDITELKLESSSRGGIVPMSVLDPIMLATVLADCNDMEHVGKRFGGFKMLFNAKPFAPVLNAWAKDFAVALQGVSLDKA